MDEHNCGIEQYPHTIAVIIATWGTVAFEKIINELTLDLVRFNRRGFPDGPFRDLVDLKELHQLTYPELTPTFDPWDIKGVGISK